MLGSGASLGKHRVFMSNTGFYTVFIGDGEMIEIPLVCRLLRMLFRR